MVDLDPCGYRGLNVIPGTLIGPASARTSTVRDVHKVVTFPSGRCRGWAVVG